VSRREYEQTSDRTPARRPTMVGATTMRPRTAGAAPLARRPVECPRCPRAPFDAVCLSGGSSRTGIAMTRRRESVVNRFLRESPPNGLANPIYEVSEREALRPDDLTLCPASNASSHTYRQRGRHIFQLKASRRSGIARRRRSSVIVAHHQAIWRVDNLPIMLSQSGISAPESALRF
jgi:hypothetical protein